MIAHAERNSKRSFHAREGALRPLAQRITARADVERPPDAAKSPYSARLRRVWRGSGRLMILETRVARFGQPLDPVDLDRAPGRRNGRTFASARDPAVTWVGVRARDRPARQYQGGRGRRLGVDQGDGSLSSMTLRRYTLACDIHTLFNVSDHFPKISHCSPFSESLRFPLLKLFIRG